MKLLLSLFFFLLSTMCIYCQVKDTTMDKDTIINGVHYIKSFTKVEIESSFKGGMRAWQQFINKNLKYPSEAIDNNIQGTVVISFIVDTTGHLSKINIENDPGGGLGKEAERIIRLSDGMWEPAIQNDEKIKSHKKQPIVFMLSRG